MNYEIGAVRDDFSNVPPFGIMGLNGFLYFSAVVAKEKA